MTRLLADAMLGALARWLRVLGVDTAYDPGLGDAEIAALAVAEGRVVLTRDRRLVLRRVLRDRHLLVASEVVEAQVRQVVAELGLTPRSEDLFRRCLRCNAVLENVPAEQARRRVPPYVARTQTHYRQCPTCQRLYWPATHTTRMRRRLQAMGVLPAVDGSATNPNR